jgi:endonuclease VIII
MELLKNKKVRDIRIWGKQFFFCLDQLNIRIHFLMFGSYSVGKQTRPDKSLRLALSFSNDAVYFYTCSVKILEGDLDSLYDWKADVLSDKWDPARARKKLKALPQVKYT